MRCGPDRSDNTNPTEDHKSRIILVPICQVPECCPHKDGGAGIESRSLGSYLIITEVAHHSIQDIVIVVVVYITLMFYLVVVFTLLML